MWAARGAFDWLQNRRRWLANSGLHGPGRIAAGYVILGVARLLVEADIIITWPSDADSTGEAADRADRADQADRAGGEAADRTRAWLAFLDRKIDAAANARRWRLAPLGRQGGAP